MADYGNGMDAQPLTARQEAQQQLLPLALMDILSMENSVALAGDCR